jgi:hypothetical protein
MPSATAEKSKRGACGTHSGPPNEGTSRTFSCTNTHFLATPPNPTCHTPTFQTHQFPPESESRYTNESMRTIPCPLPYPPRASLQVLHESQRATNEILIPSVMCQLPLSFQQLQGFWILSTRRTNWPSKRHMEPHQMSPDNRTSRAPKHIQIRVREWCDHRVLQRDCLFMQWIVLLLHHITRRILP